MKTEKLSLVCILLLLIQLVACDRSRLENEQPTPLTARTSADSTDADNPDSTSSGNPDTTYHPIPNPVDTILTGEQKFREDEELQITPIAYSDSANVLVLNMVTKNNYLCKNNDLVTSMDHSGNLFKIQVYGVSTNTMCQVGENRPRRILTLINPAGDQYHGQIEISFNNKIYKGSFKKSGNKYEFDWPYDSNVIFTTKSI
jgi:hypothetical protein